MKAVLIFALFIALLTSARAQSIEFDTETRTRQASQFFEEVIRRQPNPQELSQTLDYLRSIGGSPDRNPQVREGQIRTYFQDVLDRPPSEREIKKTVRFLERQDFLSDTRKQIEEEVKKGIETAKKNGQILPPVRPEPGDNAFKESGPKIGFRNDPVRNGIVMRPEELGGVGMAGGGGVVDQTGPGHVPAAGGRSTEFAGSRGGNPISTLVLPPPIQGPSFGPSNRQIARAELQEQVKRGNLSQADADEILRRIDPVIDRAEEVGNDFAKMKDLFKDVPATPEERDAVAKDPLAPSPKNDPSTALDSLALTTTLPSILSPSNLPSPTPPATAPPSTPVGKDLALLDAARFGAADLATQPKAESPSDIGDVRTVDGGFTDVSASSSPYATFTSNSDSGPQALAGTMAETALQTDSGRSRLRGFLDRVVSLFRQNKQEGSGGTGYSVSPSSVKAGASAMKTPKLPQETIAGLSRFVPSREPSAESADPASIPWWSYGFTAVLAGVSARGFLLWWRRRAR